MCSPDSVQLEHNEFHACPCQFPRLDSLEAKCTIGVLVVAIVLYYACKKR